MKMRLLIVIALVFVLMGACIAGPGVGKRDNAELTIYNQNFALIKETREVTLEKGINYVSVPDVAGTIRPSTVAFRPLANPNSVVVREQNYHYDLINPVTILDKSIGKTVRVRRLVDNKIVQTEGTLLSSGYTGSDGGTNIVIQTKDGILINPVGEIEVMELPKGLISKPTLEWKLEAANAGSQKAEISYLADQISWIADYVAVVDKANQFIDFTGWVTLRNSSGTTFENASLNLMAGDLNLVQRQNPRAVKDMGYAMNGSIAEPQFQEKSFFEYHLYTLAGRTTIKNNESKQISLISANKVPVKKVYIYDGRKMWWQNWRYSQGYRPGDSYDVSPNTKVNVFLETKNSKENNLGMALPKGTIRVYQEGDGEGQQFVGEDTIDHTPKDEKIRLYLGDAFDIVGEHKRTSFKRISEKETAESFEITLKNHKDVPVSVVVVEHQFGDWEITQCSHKAEKKDASTIEIPVSIPKDGETKVTYTVKTSW